jgi:hypothetical protein
MKAATGDLVDMILNSEMDIDGVCETWRAKHSHLGDSLLDEIWEGVLLDLPELN